MQAIYITNCSMSKNLKFQFNLKTLQPKNGTYIFMKYLSFSLLREIQMLQKIINLRIIIMSIGDLDWEITTDILLFWLHTYNNIIIRHLTKIQIIHNFIGKIMPANTNNNKKKPMYLNVNQNFILWLPSNIITYKSDDVCRHLTFR